MEGGDANEGVTGLGWLQSGEQAGSFTAWLPWRLVLVQPLAASWRLPSAGMWRCTLGRGHFSGRGSLHSFRG